MGRSFGHDSLHVLGNEMRVNQTNFSNVQLKPDLMDFEEPTVLPVIGKSVIANIKIEEKLLKRQKKYSV